MLPALKFIFCKCIFAWLLPSNYTDEYHQIPNVHVRYVLFTPYIYIYIYVCVCVRAYMCVAVCCVFVTADSVFRVGWIR